jgi:type II secretion system protein G
MKNNKKGFTLIELLVVIAILGLLTTIALVSLGGARSKARDARRLSDIKQIQTALELYYNEAGQYPTAATLGMLVPSNTAIPKITGYMEKLPIDPNTNEVSSCYTGLLSGATTYTYQSTNGATYTIGYCLTSAVSGAKAGANTATPATISE